jgi:rod shape-determining protein MreC
MNWRYRRLPAGQWLVFGLLLTLSVGMMGTSGTRLARVAGDDVNYMLNPVETWLNGAADTLQTYWSTLTRLDSVASENDQLKAENDKLKEQLARMPAIARLNDDWTKISQAQATSPYQTVVAQVVIRNITDVAAKTIVINRGLADGVTVGAVIIDDGGALVGRVYKVGEYNAQVLLVNDTAAVVVGQEAETGAIGTIRGQIGGLLNMQYVSASSQLVRGHAVVTAGMTTANGDVTSPYPKGLLIGTIANISTDPNQAVQSAVVQPAADLNSIEWVLVILDYKGGFSASSPSTGPVSSPGQTPGPSSPPTPVPTSSPTPSPTPTLAPTPTPGPTPTPPPGLVTPPPH